MTRRYRERDAHETFFHFHPVLKPIAVNKLRKIRNKQTVSPLSDEESLVTARDYWVRHQQPTTQASATQTSAWVVPTQIPDSVLNHHVIISGDVQVINKRNTVTNTSLTIT